MKRYIFKQSFKNEPICSLCMLGKHTAKNLEGESIMCCQGIGNSPKCPEEGCRKDCPLVFVEEV